MWYLMWRTLTGKHRAITINFLVSRHTKFAPDWCFGLLKQKFRRTPVYCLDQFAACVEASTVSGVNIAQLVGKENGEVLVPQYDWHQHLQPYFKPLVGIKKYHHFRFEANHPGTVFAKVYADSEEEQLELLTAPVDHVPCDDPNTVPPPGLSIDRQEYLFNHIRDFVPEGQQDIVCPKPVRDVDPDPLRPTMGGQNGVSGGHGQDTCRGRGRGARARGARGRGQSCAAAGAGAASSPSKRARFT